MNRHDSPSSYWKVKANFLGARPDPRGGLTTAGPPGPSATSLRPLTTSAPRSRLWGRQPPTTVPVRFAGEAIYPMKSTAADKIVSP